MLESCSAPMEACLVWAANEIFSWITLKTIQRTPVVYDVSTARAFKAQGSIASISSPSVRGPSVSPQRDSHQPTKCHQISAPQCLYFLICCPCPRPGYPRGPLAQALVSPVIEPFYGRISCRCCGGYRLHEFRASIGALGRMHFECSVEGSGQQKNSYALPQYISG